MFLSEFRRVPSFSAVLSVQVSSAVTEHQYLLHKNALSASSGRKLWFNEPSESSSLLFFFKSVFVSIPSFVAQSWIQCTAELIIEESEMSGNVFHVQIT